MQGLVARRGQLTLDAKDARKDATAKLLETATKMMKKGATPDVLTFIETTITEVESNFLQAIVDEHNRDQALIYELHGRIVVAVDAMQECADSIREAQQEKEVLQNGCGFKRLDFNEDYYEAGQVFQKIFLAGIVSLR